MTDEPWHVWNAGGRKRAGIPALVGAYRPVIDHAVHRWSSAGLPALVIESQARKLALAGFRSFKSGTGASVATHVANQLKGLDRFVNRYRSDVRMPEQRAHLADKVYRVHQQLSVELGREPTPEEIAESSGVGTTTLGRLARFQSSLYSTTEAGGFAQPVREDLTTDGIAADFLHQDLSPMQRKVFGHLTGYGGMPVLAPQQIAQTLGISAPRVSALRNQIAHKAQAYQSGVRSLMED